jgi:hypothetical protein
MRWMVIPAVVGRLLGPKASARWRGEDGGVDLWLRLRQGAVVVADDGEPNSGARAAKQSDGEHVREEKGEENSPWVVQALG